MKMNKFLIFFSLIFFGCNFKKTTDINLSDVCYSLKTKNELEVILKEIGQCAIAKDIDCFMASCDSSFILESNESKDKNKIISKAILQNDILQSWSIIDTIYEIHNWIDSINIVDTDTAVLFTNQIFHRTFLRPNNQKGVDDVLSTQRHREVWIKRPNGWKQAIIKELGGSIYVNGKPYNPN